MNSHTIANNFIDSYCGVTSKEMVTLTFNEWYAANEHPTKQKKEVLTIALKALC